MHGIRRAVAGDIDGIEQVLREVWGQNLERVTFGSHLQTASCAVWVSEVEGEIAGFSSAFLSVGSQQLRRWEVDLVVVRPTRQGLGIGQRLIEASWEDAQRHCANFARALVRTSNGSSQKAFTRAGYTSNGVIHKLLLWSPQATGTQLLCPPEVTLLRMDTLTYRGLWIEGLTSSGLSQAECQGVVSMARDVVAREGRLNTGILASIEDEKELPDAIRNEATPHGEYQWWRRESP